LETIVSAANREITGHGTSIDWDFEIDEKEPSRKGPVLAYISQMVHDLIYFGIKKECDQHGNKPQVVVAAALVEGRLSASNGNNNNNSPASKASNNNNNNNASPNQTFVIGINANMALQNLARTCVSFVPEAIGGIPVVVVANENGLSKDLSFVAKKRIAKKHFPLPEKTTVWSWHSEQKVIRYIKTHFDKEARNSVEALGIAHKNGPCTNTNEQPLLNVEANCCYDYLKRKYDKVKHHKGDSASAVAAYWYTWKGKNYPSADYCSIKYLESNGIKVKPRR
jgi:hypothetical protein